MLEEKDGKVESLTEGELDRSVGGATTIIPGMCARCGKIYHGADDMRVGSSGLCYVCWTRDRHTPPKRFI